MHEPHDFVQATTARIDQPVGSETKPEAQPLILIVDDEPLLVRAIARLLQTATDYEVVSVDRPEKAVETLRTREVAVLLTDQRMPKISGGDLLKYAREHFPETVRLMMTGSSNWLSVIEAINLGEVFRFVPKPWENGRLIDTIHAAVEQHQLLAAQRVYEQRIEEQNRKLVQMNHTLEKRVEERTEETRQKMRQIEALYRQLEHGFDATIVALLHVLELSNPIIVAHCKQTAEYLQKFLSNTDLDEAFQKHLMRAALLHWIGLINAPDSVFEKLPGEFDAVERATWEFHPLLGQQAVGHIEALFETSEIIMHYRQSYQDGYPEDLSSETASSCAILFVVSTFVHISRIMGIRQRGNESQALKEAVHALQEGAGKTFHPTWCRRFIGFVMREKRTEERAERVVSLKELQPGMVLAQPLESQKNVPIAPRNIAISKQLIDRLRRFESAHGLKPIYVWR